jgi:hypothetical protein
MTLTSEIVGGVGGDRAAAGSFEMRDAPIVAGKPPGIRRALCRHDGDREAEPDQGNADEMKREYFKHDIHSIFQSVPVGAVTPVPPG